MMGNLHVARFVLGSCAMTAVQVGEVQLLYLGSSIHEMLVLGAATVGHFRHRADWFLPQGPELDAFPLGQANAACATSRLGDAVFHP